MLDSSKENQLNIADTLVSVTDVGDRWWWQVLVTDVGDECWRRNVMMTSMRCWWVIWCQTLTSSRYHQVFFSGTNIGKSIHGHVKLPHQNWQQLFLCLAVEFLSVGGSQWPKLEPVDCLPNRPRTILGRHFGFWVDDSFATSSYLCIGNFHLEKFWVSNRRFEYDLPSQLASWLIFLFCVSFLALFWVFVVGCV